MTDARRHPDPRGRRHPRAHDRREMGRALVLNHPPAAVSSASAEKYDASWWGLAGGLDIRRDSSVLVFGFWGDGNNVPPPTLWLRTLRTTTSHAQARPHGGVPGSWGGRPPPAADGMTVPVRRAAVPGKDVCPPHTSMSYINPRNGTLAFLNWHLSSGCPPALLPSKKKKTAKGV